MAPDSINILRSIIFPDDKSFLIRNNGEQVSIEHVEGKIVGIYFLSQKFKASQEFTEKLKGIYKEFKEQEESFEILSCIYHEDSKESFEKTVESFPWLVIPFEDERAEKLASHIPFCRFPVLAIIGKDGEIITSNASNLIEDHGIYAYPFSPEKLSELSEIDKAWLHSQNLESLLVDEEHDFLIGKDDIKVQVSELLGKTVLLHLSSFDNPRCQRFTPKLIKAYDEIRKKGFEFEIIFISGDDDQHAFHESYSPMPWLALPFGDPRIQSLRQKLKMRHMLTTYAFGPDGQALTDKAAGSMMAFGSDAYPFTDERAKVIVEGWPARLIHELHPEHELELMIPRCDYYWCHACYHDGSAWSFRCEICDFDIHPKCALGIDNGEDHEDQIALKESRLICKLGQPCYRV